MFNRLSSLCFVIACALLFTHELDAMTHREWLVLPGLRYLDSTAGAFWFVFLHIPLFAIVLWMLISPNEATRRRIVIVVSAFAILHAGLHWFFSTHPAYAFDGLFSIALIAGAAVAGFGFFVADRLATKD